MDKITLELAPTTALAIWAAVNEVVVRCEKEILYAQKTGMRTGASLAAENEFAKLKPVQDQLFELLQEHLPGPRP